MRMRSSTFPRCKTRNREKEQNCDVSDFLSPTLSDKFYPRFSVYLCSAFGNFLSKFNVPYLALPFNIIAVCTMLTLQPHSIDDEGMRENLSN